MAEGTKKELIRRVGKLLALANDEGATEGEKSAAAHHAAKLMYKYGLEESEVELKGDDGPAMADEEVQQTGAGQKRDRWIGDLAGIIAETFDCQMMNTRRHRTIDGKEGMYWFLHFVGLTADVEVSVYFYKYLSRTVRRKTEAHSYRGRRDFAYGMIGRLEERLTEAFRFRFQFAEEAGTTDLIVLKDQLVKNKVEEMFPNSKTPPRIRLTSRDAFMKGRAAGDKVNLARPIEGGKAPDQERLTNNN